MLYGCTLPTVPPRAKTPRPTRGVVAIGGDKYPMQSVQSMQLRHAKRPTHNIMDKPHE